MNREDSLGRLRLYNVGMGLLHAIQGIAVVALSNDFALPVTGTFMDGPPGTRGDTSELFTLPLGPAVAAFLFISAAAHLLIAGPTWAWYRRNLLEGRSYARWIEYSLSSSLMIVLIAMITGISDIAALVALFGVNASMILFGLLQEHPEQPGLFNSFALTWSSSTARSARGGATSSASTCTWRSASSPSRRWPGRCSRTRWCRADWRRGSSSPRIGAP